MANSPLFTNYNASTSLGCLTKDKKANLKVKVLIIFSFKAYILLFMNLFFNLMNINIWDNIFLLLFIILSFSRIECSCFEMFFIFYFVSMFER